MNNNPRLFRDHNYPTKRRNDIDDLTWENIRAQMNQVWGRKLKPHEIYYLNSPIEREAFLKKNHKRSQIHVHL